MLNSKFLSVPRPLFLCASGFAGSFVLGALCGSPVALAEGAVPVAPPNMVYVPAGPFIMGTDEVDPEGENIPLNRNDERPQHTATTGAFFIDKTGVTNQQYKAYCDAMHYPVPPQWVNGTFPDGEADFPVVKVSYYEAMAYARWVGKRLPTETEFEKAARGTDGRRYPWGEDFDNTRAVHGTDGPGPVGQHPTGASPYGALDMAGNVYCWTSSWFDAYPNAPIHLPTFGKEFKVVRGGPFYGGDFLLLAFYRSVSVPTSKTEWVGIRCVEDAPK